MTMLFENRTISMILTVPNVKEFSHSIDNLKNYTQPSIPIYHGSIIHIEQHRDNENISDLIVRVPNFRHLSLPSVMISTIPINDNQLGETEARIKRRAPICPIRNKTNLNQSEIKLTNTKRFAIGLRNLSRTIITNCKSKRSTKINQITIIPVLPDVEVITENIQEPIFVKKIHKNQNSTSKFLIPKIFFIKRKYFNIKKKQSSLNSVDTQTDTEDKTFENSRTNISGHDNENEISSNNTEDISSFIKTSSNIFQSDKNIDLTTDINHIEEGVYIVQSNDDTYSECYEVTYEFDPEYQNIIENEKEQIQDQPSIKLNLDPFEYQDLTSTWLPIFPPNNYEQIDQSNLDLEHFKQEPTITRVRFQSLEDFSQTSSYQPESISAFSSSEENNQIMCINDTSIVDESYAVILQFLKHALQIEAATSDDDEFNKEMNEIFQTDKINELE